MADNDDNEPRNFASEDERDSGVFRWMSALVVMLALAGFFGLAWYAYKSGGESMNDKDVELVKADSAPVKEAPANPGGMDIPNQDKTVYGLVGGKTEKQTVERILPAPENPINHDTDTATWMSDKIKNKSGGTDAQEAEVKAASTPTVVPVGAMPPPAEKPAQFNPVKIRNEQENTLSASSNNPPALPPPAPAVVVKPVASAPLVVAKADAPPKSPVVVASSEDKVPVKEDDTSDADKTEESEPQQPVEAKHTSGKIRVQLGAYKSQSEAESNWKHISKKFSDETRDKDHYIVRVDIPGKGVFYRLQLGVFASAKEGESFCQTFASQGQGCILAKAK